ncbi:MULTISPECIES: PA4780 family RIO1-like protein kinase [unclassified Colwellia]|uniref:PA4780 family RIO1-like protein kinase n=1 Tax=unclassified Colwellia TaxID=196834 RepID=UPI0015F3A122|nr:MULTISPECIES: PA4780 family RIO1-like protein kinase [unclassified Colwellia]MBA6351644.1 serine protein kinase RIO [Colwellia sp. BRX9-1]MBA6356687.1 serine protein kinase RIO [Colwellia sp. BRX8-3]MBA6359110.1 serine protein kinase RIO [Colwellia sp. BRX8-6]MBA6368435.1 serine protein kinase RIO [Colwellia sp. BRX8-5]MBA6377207.1 serine protein kinase RIO [Colwellia sp. BRX8-2]
MKIPKRLQPLVDDGLVDEVISQLMSGKEATVYMVRCGDDIRCAKVYKEANKRSFKKAAQYQEGRKSRNSRRARAMEKGSKYGRKQQEDAWQNAEVEALYTLAAAGVRVPQPFGCFESVLLMELITDGEGDVAPRLNDIILPREHAIEDHLIMMNYVKIMLCEGIIHGDLSEFNVLVDEYGPVIIDLPQAVDASANNNAKSMLLRDVENITDYYAQFAPELAKSKYAQEMWVLYEKAELSPETELTGLFKEDTKSADVDTILEEIKAAFAEEQERLERISDADELD